VIYHNHLYSNKQYLFKNHIHYPVHRHYFPR
jgi:hypothetical protein